MRKYFSKEKWKYMLYTISHPMDGYYWIRHAERGSVPLAILLVVIFSCCFTANRLLASFVVNDLDPRTVDSLYELMGVLVCQQLVHHLSDERRGQDEGHSRSRWVRDGANQLCACPCNHCQSVYRR